MGLFHVASIEILPMGEVQENSFRLIEDRLKLRLARFFNQPIWKAPITEMTAQVMEEKWVKDVRVSRSIPNTIKVWVQPRGMAALVRDSKSRVLPVSIDGSLLPPLENSMPDLPFLSGHNLYESFELRERAIEFLNLLPEAGFFSQRTVSEVIYSDKEGFVAVVGDGGFEILLGQKSSPEKVDEVNKVMEYLRAKSVNARVIDARLSKKVLVRLRKRP